METYRMINKELSINNQELRNVVNKLKHEITYLNRQLFEQREEFTRLKASIAKTIEQKYTETMALIFPEKLADQKEKATTSKLDIKSHRRSCSNVTAADPIKNKSHSPPAAAASSSGSEIMEESSSSFKIPLPRIVIDKSARLSKSPVKCSQSVNANQRKSSDLQITKMDVQNLNDSENSSLEQTLITTNTSLVTINEEKSCTADPQNETLSDATINCLLDAPCSTPYHPNKILNDTSFKPKKVRVLMKKMSVEQLANLTCQSIAHMSYSQQPSSITLQQSSFKTKSAQIEECHTQKKTLQINNYSSHLTANRTTINSSFKADHTACPSSIESFDEWRPSPKKLGKSKVKKISSKDKRRKSIRAQRNKENCDTDSDFTTCSDEETNIGGGRRLRNKQISLKEPSLRAKLRNTTNIKLK
ncbi:uncharacterized protein LOC129914059 [Episyrphus balteatus]|uniref:uncharacterized protein LOC129914059 n=1 Tax=Episyrphus balteatus TaxID=286459 RepID=UPI0024865735|nr:uncharacterized protein LOC129914059 [Episyrphus balteatus]